MMTYPASFPQGSWKVFARFQLARLRFRVRLFVFAAVPVIFWSLLGALYLSAEQRELGVAVIIAATGWLILSVPAITAQAMLIKEAITYLLTGHSRLFTWISPQPDPEPRKRIPPEVRRAMRTARIFASFGWTFPLNALAFWCFGLLSRSLALSHARTKQDATAKASRVGKGGIVRVRLVRKAYGGTPRAVRRGVRGEMLRQFSYVTSDNMVTV